MRLQLLSSLAPLPATSATPTRTSRIHPSVRFVIGMPLRAMRLRMLYCRAYAPQNVRSLRNRLKVCRIHASTISAQMVKNQCGRDVSYKRLIGKSMSHDRRFAIGIKKAITIVGHIAFPQPATFSLLNLTPETGFGRQFRPSRNVKRITISAPARVMSSAILTATRRLGATLGGAFHMHSVPEYGQFGAGKVVVLA